MESCTVYPNSNSRQSGALIATSNDLISIQAQSCIEPSEVKVLTAARQGEQEQYNYKQKKDMLRQYLIKDSGHARPTAKAQATHQRLSTQQLILNQTRVNHPQTCFCSIS